VSVAMQLQSQRTSMN